MAINIFQGGKTSKARVSGTSRAKSVRARNAEQALTKAAVTSDAGNVAVGKTGTLAKVANTVGKVAGIASKFLPGIGGTIAKGLSNVFNDPEWWKSVPGDAVTVNAPLRLNPLRWGSSDAFRRFRPAIGEFICTDPNSPNMWKVMSVTDQMITQYLLPEIRKVINAVPLQSAQDYADVLVANATLYAIWQQLKKIEYMCQHGQTYLANMNDDMFPLFQVKNAAWLKSTIGRVEEYLRANVRLPHTLCEYLAWRFGRVYKSNNSTKAGIILYDVLPVHDPLGVSDFENAIYSLMQLVASSAATQQANADLYNAYYEHDLMVSIDPETQFKYDAKEFCLRTNLDLRASAPNPEPEALDAVYIDSLLDNPTTFMASTVSTWGVDTAGTSTCLFPVYNFYAYVPIDSTQIPAGQAGTVNVVGSTASQSILMRGPMTGTGTTSDWLCSVGLVPIQPTAANPPPLTDAELVNNFAVAMLLKALDVYNKDCFISTAHNGTARYRYWDITALSMDMGEVPSTIIGNEHVYAFANLIDVRRKHSQSYKEAETLVAKETANLVEKLDVLTN